MGDFMVGEAGPELVNLETPGHVIPCRKIRAEEEEEEDVD